MRQDPFDKFRLVCQFIAKHVSGTLIYSGRQGRVVATGNLEPIRTAHNDNNITWSA